ncbi:MULTISPECIES: hydrolase [Kitasatospora]|uniref:Hydrolase n=1 Tax=Kitasatospora arboriphila TaxID=258052 RepID=A0ABP4DRC9_9ACTN
MTGADAPADGPPGREPVLLLTGARLADGRVVDVRIAGERILAVGTPGGLGPLPPASGAADGSGGTRIDLTGYLLLPAPAEPHAHYDTAFSAALPGPPPDGPPELVRRVTEAALTALAYGATAQRTHVRIGDVHGLGRLEAVLTAAQALRGLTDLQAVAMPRLLTGRAGADGRAQLREALRLGAAAVGGCPEADPDPVGYVQVLLEAAREADLPVDLHCSGADPGRLARMTGVLAPLRPRVTLGPCDALAPGASTVLASAGVRVVCLPQSGGCAGGERPPGGLRPSVVRELTQARVPLAAGSGALRDLAAPVGRADPLEAAFLLASSGALGPEDAYDAVAGRARAVLGLPPVRVDAGFPAELLAVRGDDLAGVLAGGHSRLVVHRGRVVSRTSAVREFADTVALALPRQPLPED